MEVTSRPFLGLAANTGPTQSEGRRSRFESQRRSSHGEDDPELVVLALYRYLGRTPSRLLGVALTDAVGDRRTQNQPGTTDEYPNWRVPLTGPDGRPVLLEDVFTDRRAATLAEVVRAAIAPPT